MSEHRSQVRSMTPADERRARLDGRAREGVVFEDSTIVYTPPDEPAGADDGHRGLQHLDGKSESRPPRAWEDAEAERRAEVARSERAAAARVRQRAREARPLHVQLAQVQQALLVIQSARAKQTRETDARSAVVSESAAPNGGRHGDVGHAAPEEIDTHLRLIGLHIEALFEHIDEHNGRAHISYALMAAEDKDRLLTGSKYRGLTPEQVMSVRPELGPAKAIRNVRRVNEQDPKGNPREARS